MFLFSFVSRLSYGPVSARRQILFCLILLNVMSSLIWKHHLPLAYLTDGIACRIEASEIVPLTLTYIHTRTHIMHSHYRAGTHMYNNIYTHERNHQKRKYLYTYHTHTDTHTHTHTHTHRHTYNHTYTGID